MKEVVLITSSSNKDGDSNSMAAIDISNLTPALHYNFKQCISDSGGSICSVGASIFSGSGSNEFVAVAQANKPSIHMYQWNKPQVQLQCHLQETCSTLASSGIYLFAGSKKGSIYCWDTAKGELLCSWQAHFKGITRLKATPLFCVSVAEDGVSKMWEMHKIVDQFYNGSAAGNGKFTISPISPFRSWSPHTLPVKDLCLLGMASTSGRVATVSLDRSVVLYDSAADKQYLRMNLPQPLETIACSPLQDLICVGSSHGTIYIIDLNLSAISISAAHAIIAPLCSESNLGTNIVDSYRKDMERKKENYSVLSGHSKAVTGLAMSQDNSTLVSSSCDGSLRVWNVWTRQCLRESKPLHKAAISNMLLVPLPELAGTAVVKPAVFPAVHLRKYAEVPGAAPQSSGSDGGSRVVIGPCMLSYHATARLVGDRSGYRKLVGLFSKDSMSGSDSTGAGEFLPADDADSRKRQKRQEQSDLISGQDFLPLASAESVAVSAPMPAARTLKQVDKKNQDTNNELKRLSAELADARKQMEKLQEDNARWQTVCMKMKTHIDRNNEQGVEEEEAEEDDSNESNLEEDDIETIKELKFIRIEKVESFSTSQYSEKGVIQEMFDHQIQLLKSREFLSRPAITHEISLWQARLNPPKYLVGFNRNNCSTRHTLICPDKNCGFNISIQYTMRNRVGSWKIGSHPEFVEQLFHKADCLATGKVSIRVAAEILEERGYLNLSGRALLDKSNELGFCLSDNGGSTATRIKKELECPRMERKKRSVASTAENADRPARKKVKQGDSVNVENADEGLDALAAEGDCVGTNDRSRISSAQAPTSTDNENQTNNDLIRALSQELAHARQELRHLREENCALLRALYSHRTARVTAPQEPTQQGGERVS